MEPLPEFSEAEVLNRFGDDVLYILDGEWINGERWEVDRSFSDGSEFYFHIHPRRWRPGVDRSYTILIQEASSDRD